MMALLLMSLSLALLAQGCTAASGGAPDLTGLPLNEAQALADDSGLSLVEAGQVASFLPAGTVLAQDPLPGGDPADGTLRVTVGREPIPVKVTRLQARDPDGDNTENDSLLPNLYDGDLQTSWSTETTYRSPDFQGLGDKIGVGFSFWLEEEATMLKISYTHFGWQGEVQKVSSDDLPIALAQLGSKQQVSWRDPIASGRIWFTQLAPLPDTDRYGVVIDEIQFYR
jgi:hypothetical protein